MGGVLQLGLLVALLLLPALLLAQAPQVLPPLVLLHHLVPFDLFALALVQLLHVFVDLPETKT